MVEQNRSGVYTQFVYGPHGGKFAIMSGQNLQKAFVPLTGGAQAVYNASGILYYGHSDHLGSVRLASTPTRSVLFDISYAPFGETYAGSGSTDPAFTGQRQDTVGGLYDFPAREYSAQGRWPSPDPSGIAAFNLTDPQSINRYVYARNTPLSMVDSTGLCGDPAVAGEGGDDSCGGGGGGGSTGPTGVGDPGSGNGPSAGQDPPSLPLPTPNLPDPSAANPLAPSETGPPPPPPPVLTVTLNSGNPIDLFGNVDIQSGSIINGTLTTSEPLSPGTGSVTVTLSQEPPDSLLPSVLSVGQSQTNIYGSGQQQGETEYNTLGVQVLAVAQQNGRFGVLGPATMTFVVTDGQNNQFVGYATVTVTSGSGGTTGGCVPQHGQTQCSASFNVP
jgi:RHS repeat-associated protein